MTGILPSCSAVNDAGAGDETSLQRREGKAGMLGAHAEGGFEVFDNQDIAEKLTRQDRSLAVAFHAIAGTAKDAEGNFSSGMFILQDPLGGNDSGAAELLVGER